MVSLRAAAEIRAAILDGSLPPGSRIRQEELAARLGISREPVRRALVILEQEGLVHTGAGRGQVIATIDMALISEIYELREIVEGYSAGRAAEAGYNPKPLREMIVLARQSVRAGAIENLIELDLRFHNELYRASANRVVVETMRTQWSHIKRAMTMTLTASEYRARAWDEHEAILDAIAERQASRARRLASAHVRNARVFITRNLDKERTENGKFESE